MAKKTSKRSRITVPNDGSSKGGLVAFRIDKELASRLDRSGNKSETMNEALRQFFGHWDTCKTCNGTGLVRKKRKLKKGGK